MGANKRNPAQRDHDIKTAAKMALEGRKQAEIGDTLGLSQQQVSADLMKARKEWRTETYQTVDELMQQQLAEIDAALVEYWNGWRDSREDSPGNWQFLHGVLATVKLRSQLLGLFPSHSRIELDASRTLIESMKQALTHAETLPQEHQQDAKETMD